VPSTTVADLEAFVEGDWLRCRGVAYPSADAAGLRISPDHTWSALVTGDAGMLDPITTGLDGYGTWQVLAENRQLVMHPVTGGGPIAFVTFTDTGQMRIDFEGPTSDLVRLSGGGCIANGAGGSSGSGGGSGGGDAGGVTVTIPGPGDCAAPDGQLLPYATLADLEVLIEADWLRCIGSLPGDVGLRISPDHTWNSLERARDGMLHPVTTGFDGHGTWTAEEVYAGHFQFDLFKVTGGSVGGLINFTDSGQVWLSGGDFGGSWVRLAAGDAGAGP
jgi:hypothetical protein